MAPLKITFFDGSPGVRRGGGGSEGSRQGRTGVVGVVEFRKQVIAALGLPGSEVVDRYFEIRGS